MLRFLVIPLSIYLANIISVNAQLIELRSSSNFNKDNNANIPQQVSSGASRIYVNRGEWLIKRSNGAILPGYYRIDRSNTVGLADNEVWMQTSLGWIIAKNISGSYPRNGRRTNTRDTNTRGTNTGNVNFDFLRINSHSNLQN